MYNFVEKVVFQNTYVKIQEEKMKQKDQKLDKVIRVLLTVTIWLTVLACVLTVVLVVVKVRPEEKDEHVSTQRQPVLSAEGPSQNYYYNISYEDKVIMAKVVFAESGFEPFEGKVAVAAVILNRYYSDIPYFKKDSIKSVVTQKYQFASIENVTMEILEKNPSCMEAVEAACKGWDPTRAKFPEGALYFYAPALMPDDFQKGVEVLTIGKVNFHYDYKLYEK